MDVRFNIKEFLEKYQTTGWLLMLMAIGLFVQGLLYVLFPHEADNNLYQEMLNSLMLPTGGSEFIHQPWSILTYPFFLDGSFFFRLLYDCIWLWLFGNLHQQLLNNQRTKRLVILAVPVIAILSLALCSLFPYSTETLASTEVVEGVQEGAKALKMSMYMSGMTAIIVMLAVSCVALVPKYTIQLMIFGPVKIIWLGIFVAFLSLLTAGLGSPMMIMIIVGAVVGYLHIYLLKRGTDITEIIWSYYQDKEPKTRMTVKYGGGEKKAHTDKKTTVRQANTQEVTGELPQEIIDKILDKISAKGYDSLSREEKEILFKASGQDDETKK